MPEPTEYRVPGLSAPVEVLVDTWGVPHLYASCAQDVFLAQGFTAARDRLFQLDLWRRRGLGLLAEVFGPDYVEHDRAARLFLYRGDMHAEWLAYGSDTKRITTSFVTGINAFVALCEERPDLLPPEFAALGFRPSRWAPADVARIRSHGLFGNLEQEVARALTLRDFGPQVEDLRRVREPARPITVPDGLDLSLIPDDVLRVYRLATTPPVLGAPAASLAGRTDPEGSNNWVVGGGRTATGRPLLANDPHRTVGLPSLRYLAHLSAPGLDVIGAGEPALPGISIGHNGHIAFGLTIFPIDQEDLYVYRTHPERADEYSYRDRWEPMTTVTEEIPVAGGEPVPVELHFTRHGPVIHADPQWHTAFAVRAAWLEPGMAPYLGSIEYMTAPTCDAFVASMNRWGAPGENQVYADPAGTIGWHPAGLVPIRPNWDGMLPVPGDGRYEWQGFHDMDELPSSENPERDWVATANEMNLPADYPNDERTITYDWYHRYRHDRISEVLRDARGVTVADCVALQGDYGNVAARHVLAALAGLEPDGADVATGLALLAGWDGDESADSAAAALYEVWHRRHLRPRLLSAALARLVPPDRVAEALARITPDEARSGDMRTDLALLGDPAILGGGDPAAGPTVLGALLLDTLAAAVRETRELLGPDPGAWAWGRLHHARLEHPAALLLPDDFPGTQVGPLPRGGSGNTVGNTAHDDTFRQTAGATFRIVVDVGDWDLSVAMNSPGQSGRPGDPHYADLFPEWAVDGSFPLLYSRDAVEQHVDHRFRLVP
ncbi:penicillin acylase family protein [Pseudonocardia nigra]|uniref:penicillin acylase family protein n=1 Tax=Pseudonocardia nigra TaxID=1921578 RepID=UPI0027E2BBF4|nr:penicillin acylase family protein [Pseudonocardia nigra]